MEVANPRVLLWSALAIGVLCAASVVALDGTLAIHLSTIAPDTRQAIRQAVSVCEVLFGFRVSPYEAIGPDGWHDAWFAPVGNSFPSGHAVHFWSLFFPLAVLFPQYRLILALLPPAEPPGSHRGLAG